EWFLPRFASLLSESGRAGLRGREERARLQRGSGSLSVVLDGAGLARGERGRQTERAGDRLGNLEGPLCFAGSSNRRRGSSAFPKRHLLLGFSGRFQPATRRSLPAGRLHLQHSLVGRGRAAT